MAAFVLSVDEPPPVKQNLVPVPKFWPTTISRATHAPVVEAGTGMVSIKPVEELRVGAVANIMTISTSSMMDDPSKLSANVEKFIFRVEISKRYKDSLHTTLLILKIEPCN